MGRKQDEIEASIFAVELLVPEDVLRRHVKRYSLDTDAVGIRNLILALANEFQVEPFVMSKRLVQLEILTRENIKNDIIKSCKTSPEPVIVDTMEPLRSE